MRFIRHCLRSTGALALLERHADIRALLYIRSLMSIYDPVDMAALDLPWWVFAATERTGQFLAERKAVAFEYGAGASTMWLARRCHEVHSVEHDALFFSTLKPLLTTYQNVRLHLCEPRHGRPGAEIVAPSHRRGFESLDFADYVQSISKPKMKFDLIVIDGRARSSCLITALDYLKPQGLILFDNSNRIEYRYTLDAVCQTNRQIRRIRIRGLAPALPYPSETTLLCRDLLPDYSFALCVSIV